MRSIRSILATILVLVGLVFRLTIDVDLAQAQDPNRAVVVVRLNDSEVATMCVAFSEDQISGYEALQRSGLQIAADFDARGGTVCQIGGVGCPADDCFCQCQGGPDCVYWSYWHQNENSWEYAKLGASAYKVSDKSIEGWSWGPGSISQAKEPPQVSFDEVCDSRASVVNLPESGIGGITGSWPQFVLFGAVLGIFALALVYSQIRKGDS